MHKSGKNSPFIISCIVYYIRFFMSSNKARETDRLPKDDPSTSLVDSRQFSAGSKKSGEENSDPKS